MLRQPTAGDEDAFEGAREGKSFQVTELSWGQEAETGKTEERGYCGVGDAE